MSTLDQQPRRTLERVIEASLAASGLLTVGITAAIVSVLVYGAYRFFGEVSVAQFLFDTQWTPLFADKHFGIWPLVAGTLLVTAVAMVVALPLGLAAAIYLSELARPMHRRILKPALEVLAGIPTVVYGFFALTLVTPALQKIIPGIEGFNALGPGIVIGIMIVPTIASIAEDALFAVPRHLREASWGLGVGEARTIFGVVLPAARSGIVAACILGVSRAVGETMIVAMAAGLRPQITIDPREPVATLTAYIVQISMGDTPAGSTEFNTIFAVGCTLFVITLIMNLAGYKIARGGQMGAR